MENYIVSARKYRPMTFDTVVGQHALTTTLKNAVKSGKLAHAYLFCGPRGVGKTTCARIFAKAINCMNPKAEGEACNECESCKAFNEQRSLNIFELDAASNNSVENIKALMEQTRIPPQVGRYKVFIIDEVHMLSAGAFNALLKTLEEPPSYVIFILATTEAHKIPITILSRCQRYDFHRISIDTIASRLSDLMEQEQVEVEERAIRYVAKAGDGSMRDALSLLDQCIAFHLGEKLTYENVLEVLGAVDTEVFSDMLRMIINGDITGVIKELDELILAGRDLSQFVSDFTWYIRNLLMLKTSPESESMIDMSAENMARLKEEAFMLDGSEMIRYIRILSELTQSIKFAGQKRVQVEVALIKLARPQMETDTESLAERIGRLEELVKEKEDLIALNAIRPEIPVGSVAVPQISAPPASKSIRKEIKALPEDLRKVAENWRGIIGQSENVYANFLKETRITVDGDKLVLVTENAFVHDFLSKDKSMDALKGVIENTIGKAVDIEIRLLEQGKSFEDSFTDVEEYVKMNISLQD